MGQWVLSCPGSASALGKSCVPEPWSLGFLSGPPPPQGQDIFNGPWGQDVFLFLFLLFPLPSHNGSSSDDNKICCPPPVTYSICSTGKGGQAGLCFSHRSNCSPPPGLYTKKSFFQYPTPCSNLLLGTQ